MFDGIKSMPAKVCLGLSALIMFLYALNFIFFADCYTTNGAGASVDMESGVWTASGACFALFPNNAEPNLDESFGRGTEILQLAGTLMLGLGLGNMLILNEGAKGKWSLMIPGLISFGVMLIIMVMGMDELPSKMPIYATAAGTLLYGGAYFFLKEEGVDEGLNFKFNGLQVKDKVTAGMLGIPVLIGIIFIINNILFADGYVGKSDSTFLPAIRDYYDTEPYSATPIQVQILGALFIPYTLFAVNILRTGAKGKWPILHVSMFGLGFFALAGIMFVISPDDARWNNVEDTNAQFLQNMIISMVVWILVVVAYVRLREEGAEDGMTIMGKEPEADLFLMKMFPAVMVVMALILAAARMMG